MTTIPVDLGRKMAKGAAWMVLMRLAVRSIGLVSTIILARLLVPADFGLIALATAMAGGVEVLGRFSFDIALIRDHEVERARFDSAWTLGLIRGAVMAALLGVLAQPAAGFFGEPRLAAVIYVLAALALVEGLENIGVVEFRRELDFRRDFKLQVTQKLIGFAVTLTVAVLWRHYWALVAGIAAGRCAGIALSYAMHPYRPRLSLARWRELVGFSKWLLMTNVLQFLHRKIDLFILGRMFSSHQLGLYSVAAEISALPTTELTWPVQRALFPGFSKLAADRAALAQSYLHSVALLLALALPAAVGIASVADPLVRVFLGERWLATIPLLQILAIHGVLQLGGAASGAVLIARGRVTRLTRLTVAYLLVQTPLLILGAVYGGMIGCAMAMVAAAAVNLAHALRVTLGELELAPGHLLRAVWRSVAAIAVMAGTLQLLYGAWPALDLPDAPFLHLAVGVLVGAGVYIGVHFGLWHAVGRPGGPEKTILLATAEYIAWRRNRTGAVDLDQG